MISWTSANGIAFDTDKSEDIFDLIENSIRRNTSYLSRLNKIQHNLQTSLSQPLSLLESYYGCEIKRSVTYPNRLRFKFPSSDKYVYKYEDGFMVLNFFLQEVQFQRGDDLISFLKNPLNITVTEPAQILKVLGRSPTKSHIIHSENTGWMVHNSTSDLAWYVVELRDALNDYCLVNSKVMQQSYMLCLNDVYFKGHSKLYF